MRYTCTLVETRIDYVISLTERRVKKTKICFRASDGHFLTSDSQLIVLADKRVWFKSSTGDFVTKDNKLFLTKN